MNTAEQFEKDNYIVVRNLLDPYLVKFLGSYYHAIRHSDNEYFQTDWTSLNCNGDACGDTVLYAMRSRIEELTGLKLMPTYSFVRIYKKGDSVGKHRDGPANQVSCTMCVARDEDDWPLGFSDGETEGQVVMEPGDGVIYRGFMLDHWRDKFKGNNQVQVIIGFVIEDGQFHDRSFYGRPEPTYAPGGVKRAGPVKLTRGFLFHCREKVKKMLGKSVNPDVR